MHDVQLLAPSEDDQQFMIRSYIMGAQFKCAKSNARNLKVMLFGDFVNTMICVVIMIRPAL